MKSLSHSCKAGKHTGVTKSHGGALNVSLNVSCAQVLPRGEGREAGGDMVIQGHSL